MSRDVSLRSPAVEALVDLAIEEDLGRGDVTTACVLDGEGGDAAGIILAKQDGIVVFGLEVAALVFERVDRTIVFEPQVAAGAKAARGTAVATLQGPAVSILAAERTALNFLQRLSGVATHARRFADAVAGTAARVVDTRKTTPGWRALEKAAVRAGGCGNHRVDLGSGLLIKDNHIAACGGVRLAVERARARGPHPLRVEVEVTNLGQLEEALAAQAEVVLLDNMTVDQVREAAQRAHARGAVVEVSGGITLETVAAYAMAGVDIISVGSLTHSAPAVDLSLELTESR